MAGPISFGYQVLGFGAGKPPAGSSSPCDGVGSGSNVCVVDCQDASTNYILNDDYGIIAGYGMGINNVGSTSIDGATKCIKITAVNIGGTAVGTFNQPYGSCSDCISTEGL